MNWDAPRCEARQRGGPDINKLSLKCKVGSAEIWLFLGENAQSKPNLCMQARVQVQNQVFLIYQIFSKIDPKPFQKSSQTVPKPSQIDPKSLQKAFGSPSWTKALKRCDLEPPKNGQNDPRSGHKTAQTAPTPSQVEPKTFPNPVLKPSFGCFFATQFALI